MIARQMIARQSRSLLPVSLRPRRSAVRPRHFQRPARTLGAAPRFVPAVWAIVLDDRRALPVKWGALVLLLLAAALLDLPL